MKVILLGSIIDTENIHEIEPLQAVDDASKIEFNVIFYGSPNSIRKVISLSVKNQISFDGHRGLYRDYNHFMEVAKNTQAYKEAYESINAVRFKLINYWASNQSGLPKIEFL